MISSVLTLQSTCISRPSSWSPEQARKQDFRMGGGHDLQAEPHADGLLAKKSHRHNPINSRRSQSQDWPSQALNESCQAPRSVRNGAFFTGVAHTEGPLVHDRPQGVRSCVHAKEQNLSSGVCFRQLSSTFVLCFRTLCTASDEKLRHADNFLWQLNIASIFPIKGMP